MIFTFQEINSIRKYLLYADDKEEAFKEMNKRFGSNHNYSMVAYCEVKDFSRFIN